MCDDVLGKEIKINLEFTGKSIRQLEAVRDGIDLIIERLKQVEDDCSSCECSRVQLDDDGVGARIKELRKSENLTQRELSKSINKSERVLQKYESGEIIPSLNVLNEIADALGVNSGMLVLKDNKEFGLYLKELRKAMGITVTGLARLSGVSQPYISQIENGKRGVPAPDILGKLAQPLGVDYEQLMKAAGYL